MLLHIKKHYFIHFWLLDFKISGSLRPILKWFADNSVKSNVNKYHLLASKNANNDTIKKSNFDLNNASCEKLLEVKFDQRLILYVYISDLHKKASCRKNLFSYHN